MDALDAEEKGSIQKLAFETLVWYGSHDGVINNYMPIWEFRNLREVVLVQRLPDYTGCGCCHELDEPERGVVGFREIWERGSKAEDGGEDGKITEDRADEKIEEIGSDETEIEEAGDEASWAAAEGPNMEIGWDTAGETREEPVDQAEEERPRRPPMCESCLAEFERIHERGPSWRIPSVKEMDLTRDGVII